MEYLDYILVGHQREQRRQIDIGGERVDTKIGNHRIAQSLYLRIVGENSRTYAFRYKVHGKDRWKSIGPVHVIPLAAAKAKVLEWMLDVRNKREPGKSAKRITFPVAASEAIASLCAGLAQHTAAMGI